MITIITACLNSQKTIIKTIESVLDQTECNFEYLIIDGGSKDKTLDIIKSFPSKFKQKNILFNYISESDSGIYNAWNKGIKLAHGNWISFIGSDDILTKDYIETYSKYINKNKNLEYISSIVHVIKNNKIIRIINEDWYWKRFKRNMNVGHVGSLHHKKLYKRIGLYDERLSIVGDYELLLRPKSTLKAGYINKLTVKMGSGGISSVNLLFVLKETRYIKNKHKTVSKFQSNIDSIIMFLKVIINRVIN